nr:hypothetical protein [Burkholderia pseudomallei]
MIARTCGRPGSTRTILVVTVAMVGASGAYAQYVAGGGSQTEQPGGKRDISTSANDSALLSMREEGTREQMVLLLEQMGLRMGTGGRISACRPSWVRRRWRLTCKARFTENLKV